MCFSTCLLPVLVEEEESVLDSTAEGSAVTGSMEGREIRSHICVCVKKRKRGEEISELFVYAFVHLSVSLSTHTPTPPPSSRPTHQQWSDHLL